MPSSSRKTPSRGHGPDDGYNKSNHAATAANLNVAKADKVLSFTPTVQPSQNRILALCLKDPPRSGTLIKKKQYSWTLTVRFSHSETIIFRNRDSPTAISTGKRSKRSQSTFEKEKVSPPSPITWFCHSDPVEYHAADEFDIETEDVFQNSVTKKINSPFRLQDLPYELRRQIYRDFLVFSDPISLQYTASDRSARDKRPSTTTGAIPNFLATSSAIHNDAIAVLYGENLFQYTCADNAVAWSTAMETTRPRFTTQNMQRIRKLQLVFDTCAYAYPARLPEIRQVLDDSFSTVVPRIVLWQPMFERLNKLVIVAQPAGSWFSERRDGDDNEEGFQGMVWLTWLRSTLRYFGGRVPDNLVVQLDVGPELSACPEFCGEDGMRTFMPGRVALVTEQT